MDGCWEEGYQGQGEWNDHEHHGKEGVPREWKKQLDVWIGWIGGPMAQRVSQWIE
jgi:hypothetical protein